jgi:hypothetical protein
MQSPSIIIRGETYPAELVRIVPMERGRLAIHLTTTCRLRLGESCNLRNAVGVEQACVVAEVKVASGDTYTVELRCIAEDWLSDPPNDRGSAT